MSQKLTTCPPCFVNQTNVRQNWRKFQFSALDVEDEPIYCEIPSPDKRPLPPPPSRSAAIRGSMRSNGLLLQQGQGSSRILKTNGAITSGLGRRAITQLDMSASHHSQRHRITEKASSSSQPQSQAPMLTSSSQLQLQMRPMVRELSA